MFLCGVVQQARCERLTVRGSFMSKKSRQRRCILATAFAAMIFWGAGASLVAAHEAGPGDKPAPVIANSHAPIGVMADHMHKKGEWMLSYRWMHMDAGGLRHNTSRVSELDGLTGAYDGPGGSDGYRILPEAMNGEMHMFGGMYAPTDWVTLMVMGSYVSKQMRLQTYAGMMGAAPLDTFQTEADGFGDSSISALVKLLNEGGHHAHVTVGLSLPTGSIRKEDRVLMPDGSVHVRQLPYGMQLGSGTEDLLLGLTYYGLTTSGWNWGAQYRSVIRMGKNNQSYALGDVHALTGWVSYGWKPWISTSLRLEGKTEERIAGRSALISGSVPTADPGNYGGDQLTGYAGVNLAGQSGVLRAHRLAVELGVPIVRDLNGLQLQQRYSLNVGYQYSF